MLSTQKWVVPVFVVGGLILMGAVLVPHQEKQNVNYASNVNKSIVTRVTTLKNPEGGILGNIDVIYIDDKKDVFSALYMTKEINGTSTLVYKMDADAFTNSLGVDFDMHKSAAQRPDTNPWGFEFHEIGGDYFAVNLRSYARDSVSDPIFVAWDKSKDVFEKIYLGPTEEDLDEYERNPSVTLYALKARDGSELGELNAQYRDKEKKILKHLTVVGKFPNGGEGGIYWIDEKGFANRESDHDNFLSTDVKELEITNENYFGFQLISFKDDHFLVRLVDEEGKSISKDITVKWNYDKKVFEIVK